MVERENENQNAWQASLSKLSIWQNGPSSTAMFCSTKHWSNAHVCRLFCLSSPCTTCSISNWGFCLFWASTKSLKQSCEKSSQRYLRTLLSRIKNHVSILAIISNNEFELNVCRFSSQVRIIVAKRLIVQSSPRPLSYPFPHSLPTNSNLSQCKVYSKFYLICKKKTSGEIDLWNSAFLPLWLLNFFFSRWIVWSR